MAIDLGPRNYMQGMKWSLRPKNKIDTVTMQPLNNKVTSTTLHTQIITSGVTPGGKSVTLPMDDTDRTITQGKQMHNIRHVTGWTGVMGAAFVYLTTIKGSYNVTLDAPPVSVPRASWSLAGNTQFLTRGQKTVDEINDNCSILTDFCKYVADNAAGTSPLSENKSYDKTNRKDLKNGLLIDYTQGSIPMYPWLRRTTGEWPGGLIGEYLNSEYRPRPEDVFCEWNNGTSGDWLPQYTEWNTYNLTGKIRQGPAAWYAGTGSEPVENHFIPMIPSWRYSFYCNVVKIDNLNYRIEYELPVRYFQAAAAKAVGSVIHSTEIRRDSYAFKDVISQITITLTADTLDDSSNDLSYSLDSNGELTTNIINEHPLSFERNELITSDAKWGTDTWITAMPKHILTEYKNGKYIVSCKVTAEWALKNNIHINAQLRMRQQNGEYITRNGTPVVFEVKNIEKSFKSNEFVYYLKLLEV